MKRSVIVVVSVLALSTTQSFAQYQDPQPDPGAAIGAAIVGGILGGVLGGAIGGHRHEDRGIPLIGHGGRDAGKHGAPGHALGHAPAAAGAHRRKVK